MSTVVRVKNYIRELAGHDLAVIHPRECAPIEMYTAMKNGSFNQAIDELLRDGWLSIHERQGTHVSYQWHELEAVWE